MGFFDKVVNRVDSAFGKLGKSVAEDNLASQHEEMREAVGEALRLVSFYYTGSDPDLGWMEAAGMTPVAEAVRSAASKMRSDGIVWRKQGSPPAASDLEDMLSKHAKFDAEEVVRLVTPHGKLIEEQALAREFPKLDVPEPLKPLLEPLLKDLQEHPEKVAELEKKVKQASKEIEATDAQYAAMGETITEELARRTKEAAGTANKQLDMLSGKELLAVVQARLDLQARYNDVLATKLQEALERIAELEQASSGGRHVGD